MKRTKLNVFLLILFVLMLSSCMKKGDDIDSYDDYIEATYATESFMPDIDDLDNYENIKVRYRDDRIGKRTIVLAIEYSEEQYEESIRLIESEIAFLQEPVLDSFGNHHPIPLIEFYYDGWHFKVVDEEIGYGYGYQFGILGFSEENYTIIYLYHYDESQGFLAADGDDYEKIMDDFIKHHFDIPE